MSTNASLYVFGGVLSGAASSAWAISAIIILVTGKKKPAGLAQGVYIALCASGFIAALWSFLSAWLVYRRRHDVEQRRSYWGLLAFGSLGFMAYFIACMVYMFGELKVFDINVWDPEKLKPSERAAGHYGLFIATILYALAFIHAAWMWRRLRMM